MSLITRMELVAIQNILTNIHCISYSLHIGVFYKSPIGRYSFYKPVLGLVKKIPIPINYVDIVL